MKKLIFFQLPPPGKSQGVQLKFTLPNLSRILPNKTTSIYALLIVVVSMFLSSCEDQPLNPQKDQHITQANIDLNQLTKVEKLKYFGVTDLSQLRPGYTYTWIDTLDTHGADFIRQNKIATRSSFNCGINVKVSLSQPTDTVTVNVYEANTTMKIHGPVVMSDGDDFDMDINGSKDYDFEVIPFDINMDRTFASLLVNPDWGSKSFYGFPYYGPILIEDYHFDCPAPTDGTCDAYVAVNHLSGIATKYTLKVIPDVGIPFEVGPILGDDSEVDFEIDEDRTYEFEIKAEDGGTSESFSIQIIRPDNVAHHKSFYGVDMSVPNPYLNVFSYVFDYFDCPY